MQYSSMLAVFQLLEEGVRAVLHPLLFPTTEGGQIYLNLFAVLLTPYNAVREDLLERFLQEACLCLPQSQFSDL